MTRKESYSLSITKPEPVMAMLIAKVLMFLSLFGHPPDFASAQDDCVFLGEEEKNSVYEDGDVVIGGLFPLHYIPESYFPTYETKPKPNTYQL